MEQNAQTEVQTKDIAKCLPTVEKYFQALRDNYYEHGKLECHKEALPILFDNGGDASNPMKAALTIAFELINENNLHPMLIKTVKIEDSTFIIEPISAPELNWKAKHPLHENPALLAKMILHGFFKPFDATDAKSGKLEIVGGGFLAISKNSKSH